MPYTFDLESSGDNLVISRVRNVIDDVTNVVSPVEGTNYFLSDARILENIKAARDVYSASWAVVYEAAALCQGTLSTNQAYVLKKKSTMGEDVDGPAVAASIRADAKVNATKAANIQAAAIERANVPSVRRPCGGSVRLKPVLELDPSLCE
jgi:hypothetical protein